MNQSLVSGLGGAVAVTVVNEAARRFIKDAPRMDVVGKRGAAKLIRAAGAKVPSERGLFALSMAGDLASNAAYYSRVGGKRPLLRGVVLGAVAGIGALVLTPKLGLGEAPVKRTAKTAWMTFGWYLLGGVVSGALQRRLAAR